MLLAHDPRKHDDAATLAACHDPFTHKFFLVISGLEGRISNTRLRIRTKRTAFIWARAKR
jgi:hypothetical protein